MDLEKLVKLKHRIEKSPDPSIYFQSCPTEENFLGDGRCNYIYVRSPMAGHRCTKETKNNYRSGHIKRIYEVMAAFNTPTAKQIILMWKVMNMNSGAWVAHYTIEWASPCNTLYYKILVESKMHDGPAILGVPTSDG
jgi:hypothetical protein